MAGRWRWSGTPQGTAGGRREPVPGRVDHHWGRGALRVLIITGGGDRSVKVIYNNYIIQYSQTWRLGESMCACTVAAHTLYLAAAVGSCAVP